MSSETPRLLAALSAEARASVLERCRRRRYERGAYLVYEGDPGDSLHLIVSGRVAVLVGGAEGNPFIAALIGPGDTFGEQALLTTKAVRSATIRAVEPTETIVIGRREFEDLRRLHPEVDRLLIGVLTAMVDRLTHQLAELTDVPGTVRIYRRIVALAELYGGERGAATEIPLTQDQLAGLAGVHLRLTSRVLGEARRSGLLETSKGRLLILDADGLRRRARLPPVGDGLTGDSR